MSPNVVETEIRYAVRLLNIPAAYLDDPKNRDHNASHDAQRQNQRQVVGQTNAGSNSGHRPGVKGGEVALDDEEVGGGCRHAQANRYGEAVPADAHPGMDSDEEPAR